MASQNPEASKPTNTDNAPKSVDKAAFVDDEPKYATHLFKLHGFKYCDRCGAQFQSDIQGNPVCPESRSDCPRL